MASLTPPEHTATAAIDEAGRWLIVQGDMTRRAIVPELKQRFGLTALEACEAIRCASRLRQEVHNAGTS